MIKKQILIKPIFSFNMRRHIKVSIFIAFSVFVFSCSNSKNEIFGKYINTNFHYTPLRADIPYKDDTLILSKDYSFVSGYYGKGTYSFKEKNNQELIELNYKYSLGSAHIQLSIRYDENGSPYFVLYEDENHSYKKIK